MTTTIKTTDSQKGSSLGFVVVFFFNQKYMFCLPNLFMIILRRCKMSISTGKSELKTTISSKVSYPCICTPGMMPTVKSHLCITIIVVSAIRRRISSLPASKCLPFATLCTTLFDLFSYLRRTWWNTSKEIIWFFRLCQVRPITTLCLFTANWSFVIQVLSAEAAVFRMGSLNNHFGICVR